MATRNIFASTDIKGVLNHIVPGTNPAKTVRQVIAQTYGFDPTVPGIITSPAQISALQTHAATPPRFGWTDYAQIPDYVRLVSSKNSSEGYRITQADIQNGRVTSLYELQISADKGDKIVWWGHSIDPGNNVQCVVSTIQHIRRKSGSGSANITQPTITTSNKSFYYASRSFNSTPNNGVRVETNSAYTIELTCPDDWDNNVISYDIVLLLLSSPCNTSAHGLVSYPIAKLVVDPTINLTNS